MQADADAALSPEDQARADFYALIASLFYAGPEAGLLAAIAGADEIVAEGETISLAPTWKALIDAAAAMDAEAARDEYDSVFVGTGKAEVSLYMAGYISESKKENTLVRLRAELAELGLARNADVTEYEDHFAGLCDVMRHLISFAENGAVQKQKSFFLRYLAPGYAKFCDAAMTSPNTNFYKHVARFTRAFLDVETESFELAQ
ncbi:MAG: molecular chaperone TorD family protein [Burkholderiales bacterium]|nr:molecular chaperone TorD family protein [Burkholderiales bacterium]